jgi:hypothetical protein
MLAVARAGGPIMATQHGAVVYFGRGMHVTLFNVKQDCSAFPNSATPSLLLVPRDPSSRSDFRSPSLSSWLLLSSSISTDDRSAMVTNFRGHIYVCGRLHTRMTNSALSFDHDLSPITPVKRLQTT